jgi:ribosome recycling factor
MNDLSKACIDEAKQSMQSAINFLEKELAKIRAGKANPGMLDGVKIDYYGTPTELSQAANISTPDARNIIIQPWDKSIIGAINKAILDANVGFTPRHEGDILRIVVPPLTEERRKELSKAAKSEVENSKVNIRNARRNVMDKVKKLKDKSVPEDEVKQVEKEIQKAFANDAIRVQFVEELRRELRNYPTNDGEKKQIRAAMQRIGHAFGINSLVESAIIEFYQSKDPDKTYNMIVKEGINEFYKLTSNKKGIELQDWDYKQNDKQ